MDGIFVGTVLSSSPKHPLANVTVTATLLTTGARKVVLTDTTGSYRIPDLAAGPYELSFTALEYRPFARSNLPLSAGETMRVDAELVPGGGLG